MPTPPNSHNLHPPDQNHSNPTADFGTCSPLAPSTDPPPLQPFPLPTVDPSPYPMACTQYILWGPWSPVVGAVSLPTRENWRDAPDQGETA